VELEDLPAWYIASAGVGLGTWRQNGRTAAGAGGGTNGALRITLAAATAGARNGDIDMLYDAYWRIRTGAKP